MGFESRGVRRIALPLILGLTGMGLSGALVSRWPGVGGGDLGPVLAAGSFHCPREGVDLDVERKVGPVPAFRIARARSGLERASRLFEERRLSRRNLHEALIEWRGVIDSLAVYEERPPEFFEALALLQEAEDEVCDKYRAHRKSAELASAAGEVDKALYHAQAVLEMVPEPGDPRYRWAKEVQLHSRAILMTPDENPEPFQR